MPSLRSLVVVEWAPQAWVRGALQDADSPPQTCRSSTYRLWCPTYRHSTSKRLHPNYGLLGKARRPVDKNSIFFFFGPDSSASQCLHCFHLAGKLPPSHQSGAAPASCSLVLPLLLRGPSFEVRRSVQAVVATASIYRQCQRASSVSNRGRLIETPCQWRG